MPNEWRTIESSVHKNSTSRSTRERNIKARTAEGRKVDEKSWMVRPTNLMSRMNGKKTHTHTPWEDQREWHRMTRMTRPDCAVMCNLINMLRKASVARVNRRLRRYYLIARLLPNVFVLACLSLSSI